MNMIQRNKGGCERGPNNCHLQRSLATIDTTALQVAVYLFPPASTNIPTTWVLNTHWKSLCLFSEGRWVGWQHPLHQLSKLLVLSVESVWMHWGAWGTSTGCQNQTLCYQKLKHITAWSQDGTKVAFIPYTIVVILIINPPPMIK